MDRDEPGKLGGLLLDFVLVNLRRNRLDEQGQVVDVQPKVGRIFNFD